MRNVNVIHPSGESPGGVTTRNASLLRQSYFLDRFLWSLLAIVGSLVPALGIGHIYDKSDVPIAVTCVPGECEAAFEAVRTWRASIRAVPFHKDASLPVQFGQLAWNVFTWEPLAVLLLGCGGLAVVLQRYAY